MLLLGVWGLKGYFRGSLARRAKPRTEAHHADKRGQKTRGGDLDHDSERATRMLSRIGTLLRRTLEEESIAEIPLAQELEFTDQHLEVEQIRLGERLRVTTEFLQTCQEQLCR